MLKREQLQKKISDSLAILEVSTRNKGRNLRFFDQNIVMESFSAKLLNIIFDYNLIDLNTINKTYPGVDLGDFSRRLAFQVSYTSKGNLRHKIQSSIDKFIDNQRYKDFDSLKFLFLGPKQKRYDKPFDTRNHLAFDVNKDIISLEDLIDKLPSLSIEKLQAINDLIDSEFQSLMPENQIESQSDLEALEVYRLVFDRPALQDPFQIEGSYNDFQVALTDLITLLNTGKLKGKLVAKTRNLFQDDDIKRDLENLYHKIRALRLLYNAYVQSGEIIPKRHLARFKSQDTYGVFDKLKQDIVDEINGILTKAGLQPIRGVSRF